MLIEAWQRKGDARRRHAKAMRRDDLLCMAKEKLCAEKLCEGTVLRGGERQGSGEAPQIVEDHRRAKAMHIMAEVKLGREGRRKSIER